jgi:hypothetical protein
MYFGSSFFRSWLGDQYHDSSLLWLTQSLSMSKLPHSLPLTSSLFLILPLLSNSIYPCQLAQNCEMNSHKHLSARFYKTLLSGVEFCRCSAVFHDLFLRPNENQYLDTLAPNNPIVPVHEGRWVRNVGGMRLSLLVLWPQMGLFYQTLIRDNMWHW